MRDVIFSLIKYGLITKKDILYFFCESIDDFYKAISFKKITYEKTLLFKNAKILCTFEEFKEHLDLLCKLSENVEGS